MYYECFEKLQVCIETESTFIVIVICKLWGVTNIVKFSYYFQLFLIYLFFKYLGNTFPQI